jgi:hypothetical protein
VRGKSLPDCEGLLACAWMTALRELGPSASGRELNSSDAPKPSLQRVLTAQQRTLVRRLTATTGSCEPRRKAVGQRRSPTIADGRLGSKRSPGLANPPGVVNTRRSNEDS